MKLYNGQPAPLRSRDGTEYKLVMTIQLPQQEDLLPDNLRTSKHTAGALALLGRHPELVVGPPYSPHMTPATALRAGYVGLWEPVK